MGEKGNFGLLVSLVVLVGAVDYALFTMPAQDVPVLVKAATASGWHENKPFHTPQEFYPFYLSEHSVPVNRLLHVVGTSIIILMTLLSGTFVRRSLTLALAVGVGFAFTHLLRGEPNGFKEFGIILLTFLVASKHFTGAWGVSSILVGYGFAWVGHFFVELNKPATFIYPSFSFYGDFRMLSEVLTGKIPLKLF